MACGPGAWLGMADLCLHHSLPFGQPLVGEFTPGSTLQVGNTHEVFWLHAMR